MARGWPVWSLILVMVVTVTAGCQEGTSPAPPLCELLLDYDDTRGVLWVYLSGVEDIRFDHMAFGFNDSVNAETEVFRLQGNTSLNPVQLTARAEVDDTVFSFKATLTLEHGEEGEQTRVIIEPADGGKVQEKSLPYTTIMKGEAED